jgi:murein DD-endopeptidase MepM/ murein hydrolase activator NlpD
MNIILVSDGVGKSRTITLSQTHILLIAFGLLLAGFLLAFVTYGITLKAAADIQNPFVQSLVSSLQREQIRAQEMQMRDNLNNLAKKVGELQARLTRLDAFGERLSKAAGVKPEEFRFSQTPGQGGPAPTLQQDISMDEFQALLGGMSRLVDDRSDKLGVLDSLLRDSELERKTVPTTLPVIAGYYSSNFGYRIDPFAGRQAFHAGIDFIADPGTPVMAAAGGKIVFADFYGDYGRVIDIDHDNGLMTRYAHLSAISVKEGDLVLKGQKIGAVGSSGRSTGPHLHFEVRENGVPLNPAKFLALGKDDQPKRLVKTRE